MLGLVSTWAAYLVCRFIPREVRVSHRMLMQPALTVSGMMFSVLLGFFIAQAMRDFSTARANIVNEANAIGEVFRDAKGLPEVDRKRIRQLCRDYVASVIRDEWPLLRHGQESPKSQAVMNDLWEASLSVKPTNDRESVIYDSFFDAMNVLGGLRRVRTATVYIGMPAHEWAIIAIGAAGIITLTFLFAPDSRRFHAGLLCCLIAPLTLNIFLLAEYLHPYSGIVSIRPTVFEATQRKIMSQTDDAPKYLQETSGAAAK
ncbi:MAG: DUF4239 domain-containing protein [Candidatus Obscuribacterales bacterium]|nr:DUF4239 domain-containing protein [Candidatus Obscuribacterales bacterium]